MDYVIPATTQMQPESTEISDRWQGEDIRLPRTLRVGRGSAVLSRVPSLKQLAHMYLVIAYGTVQLLNVG